MGSKIAIALVGFGLGVGATTLYQVVNPPVTASPPRAEVARARGENDLERGASRSGASTAIHEDANPTAEVVRMGPEDYLRRINEANNIRAAEWVAHE